MKTSRALLAALTMTASVPGAHADTVDSESGTIEYFARFAEFPLKNADGQPQAAMSTISYVRKGAAAADRPVIFVFNGGPGSSSLTLNYGVFGPETREVEGAKRFIEPSDTRPDGTARPTRFVPNQETLLDIADLVMIDPVGTGFSRELRPGGGQTYWSVAGDIDAFERCIRDWLGKHGRTASPIYLAGESYGGYRAGFIAAALADLKVAGLILVSPGVDLTTLTSDYAHAAYLPSFAVAAVHHGRVPSRGRSIAQVHAEAQRFVEDEYLPALYRGTVLTSAERDRIAARMSRMIGLPAATIAAANLRVDSQAFLEQLLPGKVVGRLDDRATGPAPDRSNPARDAAADDPSLNLEGGTVRLSKPVADRLRTIGAPAQGDYVALNLDVNFRWDWRPRSPAWDANIGLSAANAYASFLAARPQARVLVASGYYDIAIPLSATRYTLTRPGLPQERFVFREYESGHSISDDPKARLELIRDIRRFLRAAP